MQSTDENELRRAEHFSTSIHASVKAREDEATFWKEDTVLVNLSRIGASFYVEHYCHVGQLVSLLFPMPKHLRFYDQDEINYRVWGLVQHCNKVGDNSPEKHHIGVAFIGKTAPPSYYQNPRQTYRIGGISGDGLWKIIENERPFVTRKEARFPIMLEVTVQLVNAEKDVVAEESTVTENISFSGAAVLSNLNANTGDWVYVTCEDYDFSAAAIVRHRSFNNEEAFNSDYKLSRIHLEFIDGKFPLEEVKEI